jgi:hypothetical protein
LSQLEEVKFVSPAAAAATVTITRGYLKNIYDFIFQGGKELDNDEYYVEYKYKDLVGNEFVKSSFYKFIKEKNSQELVESANVDANHPLCDVNFVFRIWRLLNCTRTLIIFSK